MEKKQMDAVELQDNELDKVAGGNPIIKAEVNGAIPNPSDTSALHSAFGNSQHNSETLSR